MPVTPENIMRAINSTMGRHAKPTTAISRDCERNRWKNSPRTNWPASHISVLIVAANPASAAEPVVSRIKLVMTVSPCKKESPAQKSVPSRIISVAFRLTALWSNIAFIWARGPGLFQNVWDQPAYSRIRRSTFFRPLAEGSFSIASISAPRFL